MTDETIKLKIIRLFELSRNNSNGEEAKSAKEKAEKLMKDHNLTYEDLFVKTTSNEYTYTDWTPTEQTETVTDNSKMVKAGCYIGLINLFNVILVYFTCKDRDFSQEIILAWIIITVVVAITGFYVSKTGRNKEGANDGLGIAGMAINGIILLPALIFVILLIFYGKSGSTNNNRRRKH
ncbi:MAG: hypothetical protein Ta2A_18670 [Treponemataceae bacterium]|nr:MAG: hypothetical protein Ta2A_18670 [Treponemataceae bacterium]